jgi:hypothetical protein
MDEQALTDHIKTRIEHFRKSILDHDKMAREAHANNNVIALQYHETEIHALNALIGELEDILSFTSLGDV